MLNDLIHHCPTDLNYKECLKRQQRTFKIDNAELASSKYKTQRMKHSTWELSQCK